MPNVIEINDFSAPELDIRAPDREPAGKSRRSGKRTVHRRKPRRHRTRAGRRLHAGLHADGDKARRWKGTGAYRTLRGHSGFRSSLEVLTLSSPAFTSHAACSAPCAARSCPEAAELCRNASRIAVLEKRDEPDEHRRDLPLRRGARDGRRPPHQCRERPALPPRDEGSAWARYFRCRGHICRTAGTISCTVWASEQPR